MQRTLERSSLGVNVGRQTFTDLDYADDVALLAEMLSVLVAGLGAMSEEASQLSLRVNWVNTKIQRIGGKNPVPQVIDVGSSQVEVVTEFAYLGACTTHDGSSESEIPRLIGIARNCMTLLEKHICKSHIRVDKDRMYGVYVLPVLMNGSEVWSVTKSLARRLDAFDTWTLRKILWIPYTRHVINFTVRRTTGCPPVSHLIREILRFLGHVARADPEQDQHRVIGMSLRLPSHWRRPCGRPRSSW